MTLKMIILESKDR